MLRYVISVQNGMKNGEDLSPDDDWDDDFQKKNNWTINRQEEIK